MIENNQKKFNKKIASLFITIVLFSSFSPLFAKKAEAFFFVDWVNLVVNTISSLGDHAQWLKEYGLDAVANQVMGLVMQRVVASTVNWINAGFKGKPAFVTNPQAFFQNIGDQVAGQYIFNNPNLNFLCGPISAKIKLALTTNYVGRGQERFQCTLTQVGKNLDDFMGNFENGGWENFFELTQRPQNNPIGAYLQAEGELFAQIAKKTEINKSDLLQGKGFLSYKKCKRYTTQTTTGSSYLENNQGNDNLSYTDDYGNPLTASQIQNLNCLEEETVTPGDVISEQINQKLGFAGNKLVSADEINEIVSALLNQVVTKVVGTIGSGLSSLSKPAQGGGPTFTSQLSPTGTDTEINRYFTNSAETTNVILNLPPYDPNTCRNNPNLPECLPPPGAPCDIGIDPNCVPVTP